jgi:hypothetical protein
MRRATISRPRREDEKERSQRFRPSDLRFEVEPNGAALSGVDFVLALSGQTRVPANATRLSTCPRP